MCPNSQATVPIRFRFTFAYHCGKYEPHAGAASLLRSALGGGVAYTAPHPIPCRREDVPTTKTPNKQVYLLHSWRGGANEVALSARFMGARYQPVVDFCDMQKSVRSGASILDSSRLCSELFYSHSNSQHCPDPDNWRLQGERKCFSSLVRCCEFLVSLARVAFKQAISLRNERQATANYSQRFPNLLPCRKQGVWP